MYSARGYLARSSGQCTTKRSANTYIMRPLKLRDVTRQKLSQKTMREQLDPIPRNRKASAAKHTGMHVPVAWWQGGPTVSKRRPERGNRAEDYATMVGLSKSGTSVLNDSFAIVFTCRDYNHNKWATRLADF